MFLKELLSSPGSRRVANAPEGLDALLLAEAASRPGLQVHVCRDDARMAQLQEALAFFAPDLKILTFPAWDCLPYDRVSPHRDIVARRLATLARLRDGGFAGLVLTTVNALLQRVPPRSHFEGRALVAAAGDRLEPESLTAFLAQNGYQRVGTVGEPGEYALRGGIFDLFPPGSDEPLRLDFFGDELESLRCFDPLTQLSTGPAERLSLLPVSEAVLDEESIARFRTGYRAAFGAVQGDDPLYASVSEGRPHPGMEHWLPLFHDGLETLFDYIGDAPITLDHQAEAVRDTRLEQIADFHQARVQLARADLAEGSAYNALPPEQLYLSKEEWEAQLSARAYAEFTPFDLPEEAEGHADAGGRRAPDFAAERATSEGKAFEAVCAWIEGERKAGRWVLLAAYSDGARDRLGGLLGEHGLEGLSTVSDWAEAQAQPAGSVALVTLALERGFTHDGLSLLTESDVLGERIARATRKRRRSDNFLTEVSSLEEGDHVVHVDHGIGRYEGLETLDVGGAAHDCLRVVYHGNDKLYVPVENIEVLSRYGSQDGVVELDRLGQGNWQARKAKVKERIQEAAEQLMRVAAERALKQAEEIIPQEGLYEEFAARFPYPETEDQLRAIADVMEDLASGKPMDRLVCGDVGFGKTEVALRAAFVVAMTGKQVAVVVPTTLLARQHYASFRERFAGLPLRIGQLSRLASSKEAAATRDELTKGQLDIVIGTHALLSQSIKFSDLGLLIVDEEQHFGVKQKERLKALRADVHVLTLTATPIPRTLQLAMSGVKEMSLIATPPVDRLAVRTFVLPYDSVIVREAILREHFRGGQVFYVAPRLEDLGALEERLRKLVPEVKIAVAHGKLSASALEAVMAGFVERRFDVLLSTNIVESGLDIPTANTLIIHRADMFGLSQLYQLRGRVGRAKQRGYAYLTLPQGRILTPAAQKRLDVMQTLDSLGAGFTLASHDMDIRGAGNLLGEEQSGHVKEVGIELYQQLLEEAVAEARARSEGGGGTAQAAAGGETTWTPTINLGTAVLIPDSYVADLHLRLGLYRRLSTLVDRAEIDAFAAELIDRFGPLPDEVENLLQIIAVKRLCRDAGVERVDAGPKGAVLTFREEAIADPAPLVQFIQRQKGKVQLRPDGKLVYRREWDSAKARMRGVRQLMDQLAQLSNKAKQAA
ncbi:transcription-repair coupling factor [Aquibaculum sediminis]|uniref:transcription-repair coupling factor n=1 Tax=Aquibaculum sediminis TaxID=3231907 RepID=UPI0034515DB2